MDEKRLSIRFRMDNELDRKAWENLQRMAMKEKTSKNTIALRLICEGAEKNEFCSLDAIAEKIAKLVAGKISVSANNRETIDTTTKVPEDENIQEPQNSELRPISEEVLSFLDGF